MAKTLPPDALLWGRALQKPQSSQFFGWESRQMQLSTSEMKITITMMTSPAGALAPSIFTGWTVSAVEKWATT
jgi:hypothetical protein